MIRTALPLISSLVKRILRSMNECARSMMNV